MAAPGKPHLTVSDLDQLLRATDPAAQLVPPRLLRRVIKRDRRVAGPALLVPHRKSYVIDCEALQALTTRDELNVEPDRDLPPVLLLIARPEPEALAALDRGDALVKYWRLLFHTATHRAVADRRLTPAAVRERVHRIGQTEFNEIRAVLRQEKLLLPPRDDRTVYEEFAAVYLELNYFATPLLPRYFPTIEDFTHIAQVLAEDIDGPALFAATRLAGAPEPTIAVDSPANAQAHLPGPIIPRVAFGGALLSARADRAAAVGNTVRAAILRARAGSAADLESLVARMRLALQLNDTEAQAWRTALPPLLPLAAHGVWPAEARLLYDLQKVCVDHERPVSSPSLAEWLYTGFRRPFIRPLPDQSLVLTVKHLRGAAKRLPAVRVTEAERHALTVLLQSALHRAEIRLRDRFRPVIADVLQEVGLWPQNFPEQIARDKLIEELLDRITDRGFLTLGDLRDALSRNQLKLPDLAGPGEFYSGDPLIRANRALADRMAGVYRRGEVYLRWLQRGSAAAFGTNLGRLFTLHLVLPFGGAFLATEGPLQIGHEIQKLFGFVHRLLVGAEAHAETHAHSPAAFPLAPWPAVVACGVFFWLLLHVPAVRRVTGRILIHVGRGLRAAVIDAPAAVLRFALVRRFLDSQVAAFIAHFILKPLPLGALAGLVFADVGFEPALATEVGGLTFLAASLLLNSRLGRDFGEIATDWTARRWEYLRDYVPGLVRLIADFFKRIMEAIDGFLYTVDEWLRFRRGEGRLTLVWKTVAGFLWGVVAYMLRFLVVLFIEPQVNPIKHFPVVTIAHKLLLPMIPALAGALENNFALPTATAVTVATILIGKVPGVFGFLVWELKENWRLYRANRSATLRPVVVGHHGETVGRLLKPGFHSGAFPKLYAKLRRAERRATRSGNWRPARRYREALHYAEESVRHFAERELAAYLNASPGLATVHVAAVEAGSNRIRIDLACPALGDEICALKFEEQSGWLLAHIAKPGWLSALSADQAAVLALALTGFYKLAGVDLVREQIESCFLPASTPYDIADEGLVVWPGPGYETEVVYDLREVPALHPRVTAGQPSAPLPVLAADELLFKRRAELWEDWVGAWQRVQAGEPPSKPLARDMLNSTGELTQPTPVARRAPIGHNGTDAGGQT